MQSEELGKLEFVLSHPCVDRMTHGWGTHRFVASQSCVEKLMHEWGTQNIQAITERGGRRWDSRSI